MPSANCHTYKHTHRDQLNIIYTHTSTCIKRVREIESKKHNISRKNKGNSARPEEILESHTTL